MQTLLKAEKSDRIFHFPLIFLSQKLSNWEEREWKSQISKVILLMFALSSDHRYFGWASFSVCLGVCVSPYPLWLYFCFIICFYFSLNKLSCRFMLKENKTCAFELIIMPIFLDFFCSSYYWPVPAVEVSISVESVDLIWLVSLRHR